MTKAAFNKICVCMRHACVSKAKHSHNMTEWFIPDIWTAQKLNVVGKWKQSKDSVTCIRVYQLTNRVNLQINAFIHINCTVGRLIWPSVSLPLCPEVISFEFGLLAVTACVSLFSSYKTSSRSLFYGDYKTWFALFVVLCGLCSASCRQKAIALHSICCSDVYIKRRGFFLTVLESDNTTHFPLTYTFKT